MKPRSIVSPHESAALFDVAVQERALAVLTLQDGENWITYKARFLERDVKGRFFVLDHLPIDNETLPNLTPGQCVGVSFRQRSRKLLFSTVVEARGHYVLDDKTSVPAVRYRWPTSLTEFQRRSYYRTPVPEGMHLAAAVWGGGAAARAAPRAQTLPVFHGELADLSCGGAMILLPASADRAWADDALLGVELQLGDEHPPIQVDARFRGTRPERDQSIGVAIQFIGLEMTVDGRLVLQRLAAAVQRLHRHSFAVNRRDWDSKFRA